MPDTQDHVPPAIQQVGGLHLALEVLDQASLLLLLQRIPLQPPSRRGDLRDRVWERAVRSHRLLTRLIAEITRHWTRSPGRPDAATVMALVQRRPEQGLALGLMWAMGHEIDDPAWQQVWTKWLKDTADWRQRMARYPRFNASVEAMELAEELVREAEARAERAEAERDRLHQVLRSVAKACRQMVREFRAELDALQAANDQLAGYKPLEGCRILLCGDPVREAGYRAVLGRFGAEMIFVDAARTHEVRSALTGRYDAIVYVTAYGSHKTQYLLDKLADAPVYYTARGGQGALERVLRSHVIPDVLQRRARPA